MKEIDLNKLSKTDRLGFAACRLNRWEWDELLGPKPQRFDALPDFDRRTFRFFRKPIRTKNDYIRPAMHFIIRTIGEENFSRCWWLYELGKTEKEWRQWYLREHGATAGVSVNEHKS